MSSWQIILTWLVILSGCHASPGQQLAPAAAPMATPYPVTAAPAIVTAGPPYLLPSPAVVQPAPQTVPVYPPQPAVAPAPSHPPGSVFGPPAILSPTPPPSVPALPAPGDPAAEGIGLAPPAVAPGPPNPVAVPAVDEEFAWDQIVDVVSDYFPVAREQRARRSGEVWVEGRIETAPQQGATWLEPHRNDSVGSFNRWESTFQTIRRRAVVRVIPDAAGYLVEVIVEKELEDLPTPERATAGAATFRHDGALPSRRLEEVSRTRSSARWIQLGRDPLLEGRMLAEIQARLGVVAAAPASELPP